MDEIYGERHIQMGFAEFLEAVCRVAERLAIPHLMNDEYRTLDDFFQAPPPQLQADLAKFKARPFHERIEAFVLLLGQSCLTLAEHKLQVRTLGLFVKDDILANDITASGDPWEK